MHRLLVLTILFLIGFQLSAASRQDSTPPEADTMRTLTLCFLTKGPAWNDQRMRNMVVYLPPHHTYLDSLARSGLLILHASVEEDQSIREIIVLDTDSLKLADSVMARDPLVKLGFLTPEVEPWMTARNRIAVMSAAEEQRDLQFCLLTRGPTWTPDQTPEVMKLQEAHLANIRTLARQGTLILAGPFIDGGEFRGIFIFDAGTKEKALEISQSDPAIKAGRFTTHVFDISLRIGTIIK